MAFASPAEAADVARGKKIYRLMCAKCHGKDGKGNGPKAKRLTKKPPDYTEPGFFDKRSDDILREDIIKGDPPMPSFRKKLRDKDIDDVIAYIKTFAVSAGKK
jgi:mono/diheme cytochrome c family protein